MNALDLFRAGLDTHQIAADRGMTEAAVYNEIGRLRRSLTEEIVLIKFLADEKTRKNKSRKREWYLKNKASLVKLRAEANR